MSRAKMTAKMEEFCRQVVGGKTLTDAYRAAYSAENMSKPVVRREASKLMARPDITGMVLRLKEERDAAFVASQVSDRDRILTKLRDLMDNAKGLPAESIMLRAADLLAKVQGEYKVVADTSQPRELDEIDREIQARLDKLEGRTGTTRH